MQDASVAPDHAPPRPPHLLPYQGSKRQLAPALLALLQGQRFHRVIEPFCGSAAFTLAAASAGVGERFMLADAYPPLMAFWRAVLDDPGGLAADYEAIWRGQFSADIDHYYRIRNEFHLEATPARLLYLLARAVKNAPRWGRDGRFNQSPDRRRHGVQPERVRRQAQAIATLLAGRTDLATGDFESQLSHLRSGDLIYLDPPYQGTSSGNDRRYASGLARSTLVSALGALGGRRDIGLLLSYDGRTGDRSYGEPLPASLGLRRVELSAGRSSQATLLGRSEQTFESVYLGGCLA